MKKLTYSAIVLLVTACSQEKASDTNDTTSAINAYSAEGKTVSVFYNSR